MECHEDPPPVCPWGPCHGGTSSNRYTLLKSNICRHKTPIYLFKCQGDVLSWIPPLPSPPPPPHQTSDLPPHEHPCPPPLQSYPPCYHCYMFWNVYMISVGFGHYYNMRAHCRVLCLVLLLFLSCHFSANGPCSWFFFAENSQIFFVKG